VSRGLLALALSAAALTSTAARARPDDPGSDLFTFDVGDDVLTWDTERFRFHYTVAGTHSVPVADGDGSGVPDHVEALGVIYEDALAFYVGAGYRAPVSDVDLPDNGGDGRFDVYLVDFGFSADGAYRSDACDGDICAGHMVQENDFRGYSYPSVRVANLTVGSHELFHAVQAAYDADQGSVLSEGTAVWASEQFEPSLFDLENFSGGYLDDAETPLDTVSGTPVDPFSYGSGVFFEFLGERYGDDVIKGLWEASVDGAGGVADPDWFDVADRVFEDEGGVSFHDAFTDFSIATVFTGARHDVEFGFAHGDDFAERAGEAEDLPVVHDRFVVFTTSSRLLRLSAGARPRVSLALARADQLDGVTAVLVAHDRHGADDRLARAEGAGVRASLDVDADDDVFALLINARQEGQGARPLVCAGDDDEVDDCLAGLDAGGGEGEGDDDDDEVVLSGGGCHCGAVDAGAPLGLALLALGRRRRQRRR
jgi:hypothetical protein